MRNEPSPDQRPEYLDGTELDGDAVALRALYAEHGSALLACAMRFTSDRGRAEDLVQETFLRAWRHLPMLLNDERPVRAWLLQVLRRLSIDAERARRVRPPLLPTEPIFEPAVDDGADQVVNQAVLREAMGHLPVEQQQLVIDTFFLDIPLHVTARRLGVPAGTARSRLHYALIRMRRYLDGPCVAA
jgi:RNA polymerase sigma-70 factor, ECF subfamily